MLAIFYILNILLCIWMAWYDARLLKQGKRVNHVRNGAIHLLTAFLVVLFYGWLHSLAWLCECAVVFDISLSLFRGLNPFYVSLKPSSIKDKIEKRIFGNNGFLPKVVYLLIFIIMQLI